jgi:predicted membrane chloride channel (bestrophin family)
VTEDNKGNKADFDFDSVVDSDFDSLVDSDSFVGQDILDELNFDFDDFDSDATSIVEQPVMFAREEKNSNNNNGINSMIDGMNIDGMNIDGINIDGMNNNEINNNSFDFDRWDIHRSPTRYFRLLFGLFAGITTRRITPTVLYIILWSSCIDIYNKSEHIYNLPEIELPITPFELAGPVLGLLLVFRSNTAFERFNIGSDSTWEITGRFKSIIRQLLSFTSVSTRYSKNERIAAYELVDACYILHGYILCDYLRRSNQSSQNKQSSQIKQTKILQKSLALPSDITLQQLWRTNNNNDANNDNDNNNDDDNNDESSSSSSSSSNSNSSLRNLLRKQQEQQQKYNNDYQHQSPSALINAISLGIMTRIPSLDPQEATIIDEQFVEIVSSLGICEKLLRTPIPLGYTRYSVRFVMIWLTLLPFALVNVFKEFGTDTWWEGKQFQPVLVVAMIFLSVVFLSIEDISVQIEEPFCILPLDLHQKWLKRDIIQMKRISKLVDGNIYYNNANNVVSQNNNNNNINTTSATTTDNVTTTKEKKKKKERRLQKFVNRLRSRFTNRNHKNHKNDNNNNDNDDGS